MGKREDAKIRERNTHRLIERYTIIRELATLSSIYTEKDEELRLRKEAVYQAADDMMVFLHRRAGE